MLTAHVLSPIFFLAFHEFIILSKSKASRVRAVLCCCNMQVDALEFSHVSATVSDEIIEFQSTFVLTNMTHPCAVLAVQQTWLR